jgi:hypothetical protein
MNIRALGFTLGLVALLAGCVGSEEPVIPASEAIFDARLVGTWAEDDSTCRSVVSRLDEAGNAYLVEQCLGEDPVLSLGRLGRLGGHLVLELSPYLSGEVRSPGRYALVVLHFGPGSEPDELQLSILAPEALLEALDAGDLDLVHRVIGRYGEIVLDDSTMELREHLGEYLERPGALDQPFESFHRVTDASPADPGDTTKEDLP